MNVLCVFFSLTIFQFCSVGPNPVGPSEHPIGTDGTIPYNKYKTTIISMLGKFFGYVPSLSKVTYQQESVRIRQTFFALYI